MFSLICRPMEQGLHLTCLTCRVEHTVLADEPLVQGLRAFVVRHRHPRTPEQRPAAD